MDEKLLIIEDEETLRESLTRVFTREGLQVTAVGDAERAKDLLQEGRFDLILTDIILPGITGIELLRWIKEKIPDQVVIVMTAYASLETAVETLRSGAHDYVIKPIIHEEIKHIVKNALKAGGMENRKGSTAKPFASSFDLNRIVGQHPIILQNIARIKKIVQTQDNLLLIGEIGTGKRLFARAIHFSSARAGKAFLSLNIRAIPPEQWEERFFGKASPSLTGPKAGGSGLLKEAEGGTVYLNGIELLGPDLQLKLFQALERQARTAEKAEDGATTDVMVITSANVELGDLVKAGQFRGDLYQLLSGVTLRFPPLRERKEDIEPLSLYFIRHFAKEFGKNVKGMDTSALVQLREYPWPGNIRELRAIIERAVLIAEERIIGSHHLPMLVSL